MDIVIIDTLLDERFKDNKVDNAFTFCAYANILNEWTQKFGFLIGKDHVKNHLNILRTKFHASPDLFKGLSNFS